MDRDTLVYNNIWKENHKYMDVSEEVMNLSRKTDTMHVLDLCAGGGRNTIPLLKQGHFVSAVDRNDIAVLELKKLETCYKTLTAIKSDAVDFLNNDDQLYDLIIVYDCIHHFSQSIEGLLKNIGLITRKMNSGALLLFTFLADITYPGGNENVRRLYLNKNTAAQIMDSIFSSDFNNLVCREESVYFENAQNVINSKIITGEYRAIRLVRLYERRL